MAIWSKLFTLGRAAGNEAAAAVVDANALRILDQEIRDADKAQGKARDDLAGLVARRRILEAEVESFRAQAIKYEASARAAIDKGNIDLARQVAQRIADLEQDISMKAPQVAEMVVTLGPRARIIADAARRAGMKKTAIVEFDDIAPLMEWLKTNLTKKDVVLIKGSHGLQMDRITASLEVRS